MIQSDVEVIAWSSKHVYITRSLNLIQNYKLGN